MASTAYPSKVDGWLVAVLVVAVVASVAAGGAAIAADSPLMLAIVLPFGAVLPLWIAQTTRYTLDDAALSIASGPFRWRVPLRDIRGVTPTRSPLAGPALSLDRLRIDYGRARSILISPEDARGFLNELERRIAAARTSQESGCAPR
jgi:hypothetical protein